MTCEEYNKQQLKLEVPGDIITDHEVARSEPNSRTSSIKYKSRTKQLTALEDDKRRNSLPIATEIAINGSFEGQPGVKRKPIRRVRSFRMTSKGIKNDTEDECRQSNASICSSLSQKDNDYFRKRLSSETSDDSAICCGCSSTSSTGYYRVCVMGADAVGKTALTNQFMSSEFLCSYDFENDELDEQTLSVVIDNEESTLEFMDFSKHQDEIGKFSFDAFIVVFSVYERSSFDVALKYIEHLQNELYNDRAIILVANKVDLVRKRQITSEDAKQFAAKYSCKYIETSAALNHQVDELLVGILRQIKIKLNPDAIETSVHAVAKSEEKRSKGPKGLLSKLFKRKPKTPADVLLDAF